MSWLDDASWLQQLQNASTQARESSAIDRFSIDTGVLHIAKPHPYVPQEGERVLFPADEPVPAFDSSGIADRADDLAFMVLSADQVEADLASRRTYLLPLIQLLYADGSRLLSTFSLLERLEGTVSCMRGRLDLSKFVSQPERFIAGPYSLVLCLDTPNGSIAMANRIVGAIRDLREDPHTLLDGPRMCAAARDASTLYDRLPKIETDAIYQNSFSVETPVVVGRYEDDDMYFLYRAGRNYLVHFRTIPLSGAPANLTLIDGSDPASALTRLIKDGLFQFCKKRAQGNADRLMALARSDDGLLALADAVQDAATSLPVVVDPTAARTYLGRIPREVLELVVVPVIDSPVMTTILRRLSLSEAIRTYWSERALRARIESDASSALDLVRRAVCLSDEQHDDVNLWLYQNHRDRCEAHGISFRTD